jgi:hypothetical protein
MRLFRATPSGAVEGLRLSGDRVVDRVPLADLRGPPRAVAALEVEGRPVLLMLGAGGTVEAVGRC